MIGDETELLLANETFYEAFAAGDVDAMNGLWARNAAVACIHPGHDVLVGRASVMGSWRMIFGGGGVEGLHCERAAVAVHGDSGFVTCLECLGDARLIATNVFVRESGRWHMVHHQAGPLAEGPAK